MKEISPFQIHTCKGALYQLAEGKVRLGEGSVQEGGILEELEKAGIQDGDTVRMYGFEFDYYK